MFNFFNCFLLVKICLLSLNISQTALLCDTNVIRVLYKSHRKSYLKKQQHLPRKATSDCVDSNLFKSRS